tara:strand:+ start:9240 stop:9851 length:612 start_codon:yes stop_codon:yes gene_type:complete
MAIKLKDLKLSDQNPRTISEWGMKTLKKSLDSAPWMMKMNRIKVDENNVVIGGNQRLRGLRELGYEEVPEEWVEFFTDLTPAQKKEFILKDNMHSGMFDHETLNELYTNEELEEFDFYVPDDVYDDNFEGLDDDEDGEEKPRRLSDEYSPFNLVMLLENKKALMAILNKIKAELESDSMEDSMMHLVESYKPAPKPKATKKTK